LARRRSRYLKDELAEATIEMPLPLVFDAVACTRGGYSRLRPSLPEVPVEVPLSLLLDALAAERRGRKRGKHGLSR